MFFKGKNINVFKTLKSYFFILLGCAMFLSILFVPLVEVFDRPVEYQSSLTGKCLKAIEWNNHGKVTEHDCSWLEGKKYTTIKVEDEEQFPNL